MPRLCARSLRTVLGGVLLVGLASPIPVACTGYHMVRHQLGPVQRVAVEPMRNHSYEPGVERIMTDALIRVFQRRGARIVRDPAQADLVLSGEVPPLHTRSRSFSSVELAIEFELEMGLQLRARRSDGSEVPLDPAALRDWELYLASPDVEVERKNREEAIRRLAALIAARAHDSLAERLAAAP
jgi:hypothetical protein